MAIATNCILIFHSSEQWSTYSYGYNRMTSALAFALALFLLRTMMMSMVEHQAGWVSIRMAAEKYQQENGTTGAVGGRGKADEKVKKE